MRTADTRPETDPASGCTSFPQRKAFVLQFSSDAGPATGHFCGRIEHVSSGDQAFFHSTEELWHFVRQMLVGRDEKLCALPAGRTG